jgi:hypothetical protein
MYRRPFSRRVFNPMSKDFRKEYATLYFTTDMGGYIIKKKFL